jgi:hypothetical protein
MVMSALFKVKYAPRDVREHGMLYESINVQDATRSADEKRGVCVYVFVCVCVCECVCVCVCMFT